MPTHTLRLPADKAGSMVENIDPTLLEFGQARELRNLWLGRRRWDRRGGWLKANPVSMPWDYAIGGYGYRDTAGTLHIVVVGGDGNIYHNTTQTAPFTFAAVTVHRDDAAGSAVQWASTDQASFAPWRDHLFIAIGSTTGANQNLRYDGINGVVYPVSISAPTTWPTAADNGAGSIAAGTLYYIVTFYDASTGWESDGSAIAQVTVAANRQVRLTNIPTFPGTGRTVHRRIYRSTDGTTFVRLTASATALAEITDNVTTTYNDNIATPAGATYRAHTAMPPCRCVAAFGDGIVVWGNDTEVNEPATFYLAYDADHPEDLGEYDYAGTDDDPITALYAARDGVFVGKERSIMWIPRPCKGECELLVAGVGCVSWATVMNLGSLIAFLSREGPRIISHAFEEDVRFAGSDPYCYSLAETWDSVNQARLPYATVIHDHAKQKVAWAVQLCPTYSGEHNDTLLVWHYGARTQNYPYGRDSLDDCMIDKGFILPASGDGERQAWGAFPLGFVGQMWHGQHGDGVDTLLYGYVLTVDGNIITVDESEWELAGDGLKGVVAHVFQGTGNVVCRDVDPCDRPQALITRHEAGTIELATELSVDETSRIWFGGFGCIVDADGIDMGDADEIEQFLRADIQTRGTG